jgi:tetratricopeptide (TPR) repeat protein
LKSHHRFLALGSVIFTGFTLWFLSPSAESQDSDSDEVREQRIVERFQGILEKNPRRGTTLDRVYGFHVERGTLEPLIAGYRERATKAAPREAASAWMIVGLLDGLRGRDAAAVEAFARAEQSDPTNSLAPYYRGQSLILVGQPDEAAAAMEVALERKPARADLLEIFEALGRIHQRARQPELALKVWDRFERLFPNDARVQEQIATVLLEEGELASALPRFERLAKQTRDLHRQSQFQLTAAEIKIKLGRRDEAIGDLERLLEQLNPDSWLYRDVRQRIENDYLRNDNHAGLIAYYGALLDKHPQDLDATLRLARILAAVGRSAESQARLARALKSAPTSKPLRQALVAQLVFEHKYSEAIVHYEQLAKQEPGNPDIVREWGRLILKDPSRDEVARQKGASDVWRRLAANRPNDPLAASQVADLFRQAGMIEPAVEMYQRAVMLAPTEAQYREYLGEYYHSLKRNDEALATWRQIAAGNARTAANLARLSEVLARFGYLDEAISTNADACQLDPRDLALQLKQADLLSEADQHQKSLQQLKAIRKLVASEDELEAWLIRELRAWQSLDGLKQQITVVQDELKSEDAGSANLSDARKQERAQKWYWLARAAEAERQWKIAGNAAEKAAELWPQSIGVLATLARIQEAQSQLMTAVETYNRLAAIDRRFRTEHLKKIARLEVMLGRRDQAMTAGANVIAAAPGNPEAYEFFSQICFQLGEVEEGLRVLRRAVRVAPNDQKGQLLLASALAERFRTDEAIELYWRAFDTARTLEERLAIVPRLTELYLQTNQFDRLVERLERYRREPKQHREMTLCLSQACQSAGDSGSARLELEKLLADDARDPQLLSQLVALCESNDDFSDAIRYQQQLNQVEPGTEGLFRMAQLLLREGEVDESYGLLARVAMEEQDLEKVLQSIDSLLGARQDDQALQIVQKLVRDRPNNWELLYREAVSLASNRPDEAIIRFESLLALDAPDDQPGIGAANQLTRVNRMGASPSSSSHRGDPLAGRMEQLNEIQQSILILGEPSKQRTLDRRARPKAWSPADFGQARLASWGWLMSLAEKQGKLDEFYPARFETLAKSERWRDLMDCLYIRLLKQDSGQDYRILKRLSQRPEANSVIHAMYLQSLPDRETKSDDDDGAVAVTATASGPSKLEAEELEHLKRIARELHSRPELTGRDGELMRVLHEIEKSDGKMAAETLLGEFAALSKSREQIIEVVICALNLQDFAVASQMSDRLLQMQGIQPHGGGSSMLQLISSQQLAAQVVGAVMSLRVQKNETAKAQDTLEGVFEMWTKYLEVSVRSEPAVDANRVTAGGQSRSLSTVRDFYFDLGRLSDSRSNSAMFELLSQLNAIYRNGERTEELIALFAKKSSEEAVPLDQRLVWKFGLGYLQWWNEEHEVAITTLTEAVDAIDASAELRLDLARLYEESHQYSKTLESIDGLPATDRDVMQRREVMALRLAVQLGNLERAKIAASRLFGLRLDSHLQMSLAKQMHRLGMHQQAEAVLSRVARQAGNRTDLLLELMGHYESDGNTEVAIQIAHQLLRRSRSSSQRGSMNFRARGEDVVRSQALQVLVRSGRLPDMIARLESQLTLSPQSLRLLETLQEYYEAAGNEKQVRQLTERLSEVRGDPRFQFELGLKLLGAGRIGEATVLFHEVLKRDPHFITTNYEQVFNGYRSQRQLEEYLKLVESVDVTAFAGDSDAVRFIVVQLLEHEPTRARSWQFFKKAWQAFPKARYEFVTRVDSPVFWEMPDVLEYAWEGMVPTPSMVQANRWHGFDSVYAVNSDGTLSTPCNRILDLAAEQNKLEDLARRVADSLHKLPTWKGGKVFSQLVELRRGNVDLARTSFETMLPAMSKLALASENQVLLEVAQELMYHASCVELAVRYFELANSYHRSFETGYETTPYNPLVELLKSTGRRDEAHRVLVQFVKLRQYNRLNRTASFADAEVLGGEFRKLGFPVEAVRLYQRILSHPHFSRQDSAHSTKFQLIRELRVTLSELSPDAMESLLMPPAPAKTRPEEENTFTALQEAEFVADFDVCQLDPSRAPDGDFQEGVLESHAADLIAEIGAIPNLVERAQATLARRRVLLPDDFDTAILAAHLALASGRDVDQKLNDLIALMDRIPVAARPEKGELSEKPRTAALKQVPLWLIARQCLVREDRKELGEKLAVRALEASRAQSDNHFAIALLYEWGTIALKGNDAVSATRHWNLMVELSITDSDKGRNFADGAPRVKPVAMIRQWERGYSMAAMADSRGLTEFSMAVVARLLHGGPPRDTLASPDQSNLFGDQQMGDDAAQRIHELVSKSLLDWRRRGADAAQIYELLRGIVFPEDRPREIYLYPTALRRHVEDSESLGTHLIQAAIRVKKTEEIMQVAEQRGVNPMSALPARVFLGQLALATGDMTTVNAQLAWLSERQKVDSQLQTSELACQLAIPALRVPETTSAARLVLAQAVDRWHRAIQTSRGQQEPVTSLTFLLVRHDFQTGNQDEARKRLDSWLALQTQLWSQHGQDYLNLQRKGAFARAAEELAKAGLMSESLAMLGRSVDLVAILNRRYGDSPQGTETVFHRLWGLPDADEYELLKGWTFPTDQRRSVRMVTGVIRGDRIPRAFDALRTSSRGPGTSELMCSLEILIEAARSLGRLDELTKEMEPHAAANIENADFALALFQLASGRGAAVLDRIQSRAQARLREIDERSSLEEQDYRDTLLARNGLRSGNPEVVALSRQLAQSLIRNWRRRESQTAHLLRHALCSALIGPNLANEVQDLGKPFLRHWVAGTTLTGGYSWNQSLPLWWSSHEQMLMHKSGPGLDCLYLAYPLTGDFTIECEALVGNMANSNLGYGGIVLQGLHGAQSLSIFPIGRPNSISLPDCPENPLGFNRLKLRVSGQDVTGEINGHPVPISSGMGQTSPFVLVCASRQWDSTIRNLRISGSPVVPREVWLIAGESLLGWTCEDYRESLPDLRAKFDRSFHSVVRKVGWTDWFADNGELHGQRDIDSNPRQNSCVQSRICYNRPLRDNETLTYEFWYEPGDAGCVAHPTLDRLAFLLEADGVHLHWMTVSNADADDLVPVNNSVVEPESRRGPPRLPLIPHAWNRGELALRNGTMSLKLNDVVIYQRPIESNNLRQFGFYHDKSRHRVRVRNVVLTGDWPETLGPEILKSLLEPTTPATPESLRLSATIADERLHSLGIDHVLRQARGLPAAERFSHLRGWGLPGDQHDTFRLYGAISPGESLPASPGILIQNPAVRPATGDAVARSPMSSEGQLIAPVLELIAVAKELGRLDELETEVRSAPIQSDLNRRSVTAMLGLIAMAKGDTAATLRALQSLTPEASVGLPDGWPQHERWPELMLVWNAASASTLVPAATELAGFIAESQRRRNAGPEWGPLVVSAMQRLRDHGIVEEAASPAPSVSPRHQWNHVTLVDAEGHAAGQSPRWQFQERQLRHLAGHGNDLLYFQSPLTGTFSVECEVQSTGTPEPNWMYNTWTATGQRPFKVFEISRMAPHEITEKLDLRQLPRDSWRRLRLDIEPRKATWSIDGNPTLRKVLPQHPDPWLAISSRGWSDGSVRAVRMTGSPVIPTEIPLTSQEGLDGWWPGLYQEFSSTERSPWARSGEEIVGRIYGGQEGRFRQCVLQYLRPLREDGQISYEFYHEPHRVHVHPALGRMAFLLDPAGVKLHPMTDAQFERTGLEPGHQRIEPDCQRGGKLPLKPNAWNLVTLSIQGDKLTLSLNGSLIYERTIEADNSRQFGLFHYAGDTEVRVRKVLHRGDWPKVLPSADELEFR